ncbi:acyl-CoA desaturase [Dyadobacter sp. Leaf189]|uniref:fatty acid desaturase family protein n=1 Tax=Dyadobacter sp. Leaf189 TaxID=1736295 RepID=UPI0006F2D9BA|nr:acyl-CoA desaturase [Dyadobacter sp. Leaf189]KQS27950.1 fatty acid desaturase [Dyadobacter sp. Leaf189]
MQAKERIKFTPAAKSQFFPTLKTRIESYFTENKISRHANSTMVIKTIVLLGIYILPFCALLLFTPPFWVALLLWFLMGLGISGIGMSIMHDANHGAYSTKAWVNKWLGYTIYLAGAGVTNWKLQHNVLHHTYTNIATLDEDIRDRGVVKLSPHSSVQHLHRFQWLYAFLFYGILTLYWVTAKDFIQYHEFKKSGVNKQTRRENNELLAGLIIMKVIYFSILFVLPVAVAGIPFWQVFAGFCVMHITSGLVLTIVFQLAHSVEGTSYPVANGQGNLDKDWAIHQLETTVNFAPKNRLLTWFLGGLNFQIEHHLFPKICHVHYPQIAVIVKETAHEFGVPYMENKSFTSALRSHISSLRRFGMPSINDAIG